MMTVKCVWRGPNGGSAPNEYAVYLDGRRVGTLLIRMCRRGGPWRVYVGYGDEKLFIGTHLGHGNEKCLQMIRDYLNIPSESKTPAGIDW